MCAVGGARGAGSLSVAAAANLAYALDGLNAEFRGRRPAWR